MAFGNIVLNARTYWAVPSFLYHPPIAGLLDETRSFMPINPVVTPSKLEQFTGFICAEDARWSALIKVLGIKPD